MCGQVLNEVEAVEYVGVCPYDDALEEEMEVDDGNQPPIYTYSIVQVMIIRRHRMVFMR